MSYLVKHSSRYVDYIVNFPADDNNLTGSFVAEADGEIYDIVNKTNIASFTLSGVVPTLPVSVASQLTYPVSIIKTTAGQTASITFRVRRAVNKTITTNVATTLAESVQGTYCFFIHSSDNKLTIIDNSLINSSNYVSGTTWTTDPKTVVSLPVVSGITWETCIEDRVNDRLLIFGRNTSAGTSLMLTTMPLSGSKKFQIWNKNEYTQNAYDAVNIGSGLLSVWPLIDHNDNDLNIVIGAYRMRCYLSNKSLTNWVLSSDTSFIIAASTYAVRKYHYNFKKSKFVNPVCFQKASIDNSRIGNFYNGSEGYAFGFDNVSENVYKYQSSVGQLTIYNNNISIGYIVTQIYLPKLIISSSSKRRMLITGNSQYLTNAYQYNINIINLDTNTHIRTEAVFTDTNVTGCKDGDYCNAIDMFCLLSDGTAATSGRRMVYYCSSDYDGTNPLLKYKVLLDYDSTFMCTNRLRY